LNSVPTVQVCDATGVL